MSGKTSATAGGAPWKGLLAGAVGGLLSTAVMDAFQAASIAGTRKAEDLAGAGHSASRQQKKQLRTYEYAHEDTAEAFADVAGARLTGKGKKIAAPATHYLFGALAGGVYGLLAEYVPPVTAGFGTAFGASLFLGASESVLPALGLLPPPAKTPPLLHAGGLLAHAVYGASTEGVRRLVRREL